MLFYEGGWKEESHILGNSGQQFFIDAWFHSREINGEMTQKNHFLALYNLHEDKRKRVGKMPT